MPALKEGGVGYKRTVSISLFCLNVHAMLFWYFSIKEMFLQACMLNDKKKALREKCFEIILTKQAFSAG